MAILRIEKYTCKLSPAKVNILHEKFYLGDYYRLSDYEEDKSIKIHLTSWLVFIKIFWRPVCVFLLRVFLSELLSHYRISISQLCPNGYRKILCFNLLCQSLDLVPTKKLFRYFHHIAGIGGEWFTFSVRPLRQPIVTSLIPYNKSWRKKFFMDKEKLFLFMHAMGRD